MLLISCVECELVGAANVFLVNLLVCILVRILVSILAAITLLQVGASGLPVWLPQQHNQIRHQGGQSPGRKLNHRKLNHNYFFFSTSFVTKASISWPEIALIVVRWHGGANACFGTMAQYH